MTERTLAVWLQPEWQAGAELDAVIARLAAAHGTAAFPAHVTLLGPLRQEVGAAVTGLGRLADTLSALRIEFDEVRCEPAWQRSLYLAAVATAALGQAAQVAARALWLPGQSEYQPHLSLQYSELPITDKRRLASSVALELPLSVRFDRLSLWRVDGSDARRWRLLATRTLDG